MKISGYVQPPKRARGTVRQWAVIVGVIAVLHVGMGIAWAALRFQVKQRAAAHEREYVEYFDIAPLAPAPPASAASLDTAGAPADAPPPAPAHR